MASPWSQAIPVPRGSTEADSRAEAEATWGAALVLAGLQAVGTVRAVFHPHRPVVSAPSKRVETNGGALPPPLTASSPVWVFTAYVEEVA